MKATRAEIEMIAIAMYESWARYVSYSMSRATTWSELTAIERAGWRVDAKRMLEEKL